MTKAERGRFTSVADGRTNAPSLFDAGETATPVGLALETVEKRESGIVWMRNRVERGH
jgi:hypothetical protein